MKVAITAANGNLGRALVSEFMKEFGKENVIGIARTPEKAQSLDIEIRKGDYNSYEDFLEALKGIDLLLVVSGMDAPEKRIGQHRNIIRAAEANKVKKLVYTSIIGVGSTTSFDAIIESNRQTERDIAASSLNWAIGRNGLYIEPDLEYIETYKETGAIINCAGEGKCAYTSRAELARAYVQLLKNDALNGKIYNLGATPITQTELAEYMNAAFNTTLKHQSLSAEEYKKDRQSELGEFMGMVVAGIYEGICNGGFDVESDFEKITGRPHKEVGEMIDEHNL